VAIERLRNVARLRGIILVIVDAHQAVSWSDRLMLSAGILVVPDSMALRLATIILMDRYISVFFLCAD